ncbi:alpha/beta fold hydrolase [Aeromicrobium sp.]|uniref:alpha/beta fold hydrolase n=1 Tax=Aeromicrobium sp. TaxID=1871063 RepID=UPI003D6B7EBC
MTSAGTTRVRYHDVHSADGTRLRAWTNDAEGPTVLLVNGLGANPHAWPSLAVPDCGVRIISWNHRGVSGSDRPKDRSRVDLDAFVEDALAVLDDSGVESCVVMGWSAGVTVAFELAGRHPERVKGVFAVAGVPGNTLSTALGPLGIPHVLARRLTVGTAQGARATGRFWAPLTTRLPWTTGTANLLRWTRFVDKSADPAVVRDLMQEILSTDPDWYARLTLGVARHRRVSLSSVKVPVTLLAGSRDMFTGARDMRSAAERIENSVYIEIDASHFIPFGEPQLVLDELKALIERAG